MKPEPEEKKVSSLTLEKPPKDHRLNIKENGLEKYLGDKPL